MENTQHERYLGCRRRGRAGEREQHDPGYGDEEQGDLRLHACRVPYVVLLAFSPLNGIRVVDLTSSLAGPTCTQILAALGADVVKIEHPRRGDEARAWGPQFFEGGSVLFFAANASKRSLGLDIKTADG